MDKRFKPKILGRFIATLALILVPVLTAGQVSQSPSTALNGPAITPMKVTLWMEWQRGDPHYGPNFIQLRQPCQNSAEIGCTCGVRFATRTTEFADYIASFRENKVPVVYQVTYSPEGQANGARFFSVGTWSRDKFSSPNDGLLGIDFRSQIPQRGQHLDHQTSLPAACFPSSKAQESSQGSGTAPSPSVRPALE